MYNSYYLTATNYTFHTLIGLKYILAPLLFLNILFIRKLKDKEISKYICIFKNTVLIVFFYLVIVCMISIDDLKPFMGVHHIMTSLMVILVSPIIIFKATTIKYFSKWFFKVLFIFKKCFNVIFFLSVLMLPLIYFLDRSNSFNNYSNSVLFFLTFIFFLINDYKN